jgi:hypothetical protein
MAGPKLFMIPVTHTPLAYQVLVAGSDNADSIRKAKEVVSEHLSERIPADAPRTIAEIKNVIEDALEHFLRRYVDWAPDPERNALHASLMFAIRAGFDCHLFRADRNMLIEEDRLVCLGSGAHMARYALELLLGDPIRPSLEVASQIVTYVVSAAKEHVDGVGKGTNLHRLHQDGTHDGISKPERDQLETKFDSFWRIFRQVVSCVDAELCDDASVQKWTDMLRDQILDIRAYHRKRIENRLKRIRLRVQQDPEQTKADPSPPQPLPGSLGGSDES